MRQEADDVQAVLHGDDDGFALRRQLAAVVAAKLRSIAQSRTEPASRVERARILLAYREDPSFFAVATLKAQGSMFSIIPGLRSREANVGSPPTFAAGVDRCSGAHVGGVSR
jgi:hypothetical protein